MVWALATLTMHLTNYSINKYSPAFVPNKDGGRGEATTAGGQHASKWSFQQLGAGFATSICMAVDEPTWSLGRLQAWCIAAARIC